MDLQRTVDRSPHPTPLSWQRSDGALLVSGEIDESSSWRFAQALQSLGPAVVDDSTRDGRSWLLDLRPTRLLAAAGVTTLLEWLHSLEQGDTPPPRITIVPSANVSRVLDICRLADAVPFCHIGPAGPALA